MSERPRPRPTIDMPKQRGAATDSRDTKKRTSPERKDKNKGDRRERNRGDRKDTKRKTPDITAPTRDRGAIDAARARAMQRATPPPAPEIRKQSNEEEGGILGVVSGAGSYMFENGKDGLIKAAGASAALGYLGTRSTARGVLYALDWVGRGLDKVGKKLIDKNIPYVKYITNPMISLLDFSSKKLGLEKSLYEQIQKSDEDKKKLAAKLLKELRARESKAEKKEDAEKKKKKRRKKIEAHLGVDVADAIIDDIDALDKKTSDSVSSVDKKVTAKAA